MQTSNHSEILVSYFVPAFNHSRYVSKTLDALLAQTHPNMEILVCDDCSTDGTAEIIQKYADEKKVIFIKNDKPSGIAHSMRRMLEMARGEFFGMCASDDWVKPDKVEKQVKYLSESGKDGVYGPVIKYFEDTGKYQKLTTPGIKRIIDNGKLLEYIYRTGEGAGLMQSGLFRTDKARKVSFPPKYKSDDFLFQIRFLQAGFSVGYLDEPLVYYRIHSTNAHKDRLYCLNELTLPIFRNFIPKQYRGHLIREAYCQTAVDLADQMDIKESLKLQKQTLREYPSISVIGRFAKADLRYLMKKTGLYRVYWKIAHPKIPYPYSQ